MPERKVYVYRDKAGEWRWRLKAPNGEIIAESGEGYKKRSHAVEMAERVADRAEATFVELHEAGDDGS